ANAGALASVMAATAVLATTKLFIASSLKVIFRLLGYGNRCLCYWAHFAGIGPKFKPPAV
ncbi:MAG TPA: hypothetical protein VFK01_14220, partial [Bradyrhizobium sp.]|nr:hypothetical protein [Bradyrhizobium sp.]